MVLCILLQLLLKSDCLKKVVHIVYLYTFFARISLTILNTYKTVFSDKSLGAVMAVIVW